MFKELCNIKDKRILVIGDSMLDHYIKIDPSKISAEYPGLIFNYIDDYYELGGASNVSKNISKFNINVDLLSVIGKDLYNNRFKKMLEDNNINSNYIVELEDYKTIIKERYYSLDYKQIIRIDNEKNQISEYDRINKMLDKVFNRKYDLIIISDYRKGLITNETFNKIIKLAIKNNIKVICDPKDNQVKYHNLYILKPNKKEMMQLLNCDIDDKKIINYKIKNNIENIVLTLGNEGIILYDKDNNISKISARKQEVYDITGAGDTILSYLGVTSVIDLPLLDSCKIANIAGSVKVNKFGTQSISLIDIYPFLNNSKVLDTDIINNFCDMIRNDNKKIVFTNGCFDIIHTGHIHLLKEAKKLGDILILGLNSDTSIKKLKGESRPINNVKERIELLSNFGFIDYIVVFDEDTPLEIIKLVNPDILVKGADYKDKYVIGTNEVLRKGGKVELISLVEGKSTTKLIEKLKGDFNV